MKNVVLTMLLVLISITGSAQLTLESNGKVAVNGTTNYASANLSVGNVPNYNDLIGADNYGMFSFLDLKYSGYNTAVYGLAYGDTDEGVAIGVAGCAGFGSYGSNFGVVGGLVDSEDYGAAIYGSLMSRPSISLIGRYAGYFNGAVRVNGTLSTQEVLTTSDMRLKDNVASLSNLERNYGSTLGNLLDMNIIEYNYKSTPDEANVVSGVESISSQSGLLDFTKRHFGLSAQELQKVYPNLVTEGQDGYLAVNYIELVPLLIRSLQEMQKQLDELKGSGTVRKAPSTTGFDENTTNGNILYQNTPNPFRGQTTIRFQLADDATNAAICIFDMQGKLLKKLPVTLGMDSITVNGYELGEGMFLYTLMVNGQEVATKRMILSK